jgi:putative ABC transport system substrate-binding protein
MTIGIGRREFVTALGGTALVWQLVARAQQVKRVGVLDLGNADAQSFATELREGLRTGGYIEGQNIEYAFRSSGNIANLPKLAAELVGLRVDVPVALFTPFACGATGDAGDSNRHRLRRSRGTGPGREPGPAGRQHHRHISDGGGVDRQMRRAASRHASIGAPGGRIANDDALTKLLIEKVRLAGGTTGIEIAPVVIVGGKDELDAAFLQAKEERADAVVVQASLPAQRVVDLAFKYRLPVATVSRSFAEVGALMTYGVDGPDSFRLSAAFVQKILQGIKPADLPVEQPTKFQLVINLKTAKALGLTVAPQMLGRADDVIE